MTIARRTLLSMTVALGLTGMMPQAFAAEGQAIEVYKNAGCGCCDAWVDHLRANGFSPTVHEMDDISAIKAENGVTNELASCHTAIVDGYVVEGHVPATDIQRLLKDRPAVRGLSAPGMPMGSPGMEGFHKEAYDVVAFDKEGKTEIFARH